jgi:hypothetical protein
MKVFGSQPAWFSRRALMAVGVSALAALSSASMLHAQTPPAAPATQQPAADPFVFSSEAVAIIYSVQTPKAADFDAVWKRVKEAAAATDIADVKAFGASLRVYKIDAPGPAGATLYLFLSDPMPKGVSMDPGKIIFYGFPSGGTPPATPPPTLFKRDEADKLYKQLAESLVTPVQITSWPLVKIVG